MFTFETDYRAKDRGRQQPENDTLKLLRVG
jgi:hypothetical protein